ncbi:hypothetical protein BpsS36_00057 [Bacillus phage vB_BpsS-36]|uniref:Serine/threonine protein kinase n=1 Tax=Bacillus phage vB_BpsS-36 TaxID=2419622 RepID=A0A3G3BWU2_9CAUD|nr:hypothetical protein BpsS36_00057 [Bacillus phage vB_BpsS-36]
MKKQFKSSGFTFKVVSETPQSVLNQFNKVVNAYAHDNGVESLRALLDFIGGGACGKVFDLGNGYVIKVNDGNWTNTTRDGEILEALQGLPFIPKLYAYSLDNKFMLVQKIEGQTLSSWHCGRDQWSGKSKEELLKDYETFRAGCLERGWRAGDMHESNMMVDANSFWIVDVGLYKEWEEGQGEGWCFNDIEWSLKRLSDSAQARRELVAV